VSRVRPTPMYSPPPKAAKPKGRRVSRQRRERLNDDAFYLVLHDAYLAANPICTRPGCVRPSRFIHHICSGTAGKAASLLNTNTWLEYCDEECHEFIECLPFELQRALKALRVQETIDRLR
jgi:hypothetical protein